uniref:Uncharacterized protein n=1 Tax=Siphoviridae sp. ctMBu2 TaxID=2827853 RepID=A0A8S5T585_9CAUD|nr:MAG TPA: hypothetical protein [Siphoviridae sp. ctMBu2]
MVGVVGSSPIVPTRFMEKPVFIYGLFCVRNIWCCFMHSA